MLLTFKILEEEDMATQEILTQEKSLILLLITDHHMTTVELNMTLKLALMAVDSVQIN